MGPYARIAREGARELEESASTDYYPLDGAESRSRMLRFIGALCSVLLVATACRPSGGIVATYKSPTGAYTVQLAGKSTAPRAMFVEHLLYANAFKGPAVVVRNWEVHFADMLDTAFDDEYSGADWPQANVLRFRTSSFDRALAPDVIVLANHRRDPLAFVTVKSADLFLVFDLAAGSTIQLLAPPQARLTDLSWVKVEGQWTSGKRLPATGVNFVLPKQPGGQFKYVADIFDERTQIREVQQGAKVYH